MHALMISMDTSILTQTISNSRERHDAYGEQLGRISMIVCNRRGTAPLPAYDSAHLAVRPTESRGYVQYLLDGYRTGLRFHAEHPIDLITSQDPFLTGVVGLALRRRFGAPLVVQDHSSLIDNRYFAAESRRNRWLQRLARWTIRRADAVRVVNHAERLACIRHGLAPERVCVAPVPAAIGRFLISAPAVDPWRERLGLEAGTPVVLWVGRAAPVKNLPMLLRAFSRVYAALPSACLIITGDMSGTAIPDLVTASGLSSSVCLPGSIAHADLPALYQLATVYAHSSTYEGFGVVMIEASASGLPVVSTDTDGARDIVVDGQTGLLVPVGDEAALADALLGLLREPDRARVMGAQARDHVVQAFDETRLTVRWISLLQAVADRKMPCAS